MWGLFPSFTVEKHYKDPAWMGYISLMEFSG